MGVTRRVFGLASSSLAMEASADVDPEALAWLFNTPPLVYKSNVQEFVASIPGDIYLPNTTPPSCGAVRQTRLNSTRIRAGAVSFAHGGVPYGVSLPETLLGDVRINSANIDLMRSLWADKDPVTCMTSGSTCALLAGHIVHEYPPRDSELAWLQDRRRSRSTTLSKTFVPWTTLFPTGDLSVARAFFVGTLNHPQQRFRGGLSELLRRAEIEDHLHSWPTNAAGSRKLFPLQGQNR
ncbi:hypothetical protein BJY52DRAFT_1224237 [Lactarius psammicola]|nr:hypothetical protein BJY52DRAFT_1224237 [Lactarius psammicola]